MRVWALGLFLLSSAGIAADQPPADESEAEIMVEGLAKPQRASFEQFREAQEAFRKHHASLAPSAAMVFQLRPIEKLGFTDAKLDGIHLALVGKDDRIEIKMDSQHRFTMPDLNPLRPQDYRLMANIGKKPIVVSPYIYSPGTSQTDRRLGDVRLECQTGWAFWKSETNMFVRGAFGMIGGCSSKRIVLYIRMPGKVESATAVDRGKMSAIVLNPKFPNGYRVPIYDKSLSNDARIRIVLK
jgi:hypothetical protein